MEHVATFLTLAEAKAFIADSERRFPGVAADLIIEHDWLTGRFHILHP
jgi:hypothetical protein